MRDKRPETIKEVDTRYCSVAVEKLADVERMIGGVMIPASMAKAC